MGKKYLTLIISTALLVLSNSALFAQGTGDVLRYGLQYPEQDAVSLVMPGTSDATGFGAYQQNPASMALFDQSFFSFGLSDRYANEDGTYLGNTSSFDNNQLNVGNIGFVYNVPTTRGKLTVGAGYSQSHDFNRAVSGNGRNNQSTITDFYAITPDDGLFNTAFDAYAVDHIDADDNSSDIASIFRVDSPYKGINQNFEFTERGVIGEYSAFVATEFQKNLIVGASIGIINGTYSYRRSFLESDNQNDYETQFKDKQGNKYGIDNILSDKTIDDKFTAFSLRIGGLYKVSPHLNVGVSYQFKNVLHIDEDFNTVITNTFDDGTDSEEDAPAQENYKVTRPARLNFGLTIKDLSGVTLSASAEKVNYTDSRIGFDDQRFKTDENDINNIVETNFEDVYNLRLGLQYEINKQFVPRIGYAYYPSPTKNVESDRSFYSAGFTSQISEYVNFNVGAQLGLWDDQVDLYSTYDVTETVTEDVSHWNVMAGLTFTF